MNLSAYAGRPVIIGGGLAGLLCALHLAPRPVLVLAPTALGTEAASAWAQGGVAASVGPDDDAEHHLADTLEAGDGLCDARAARTILAAAPDAIATLVGIGARFDRDAAGVLRLGLEAAHGRRRIVHASGDATGREIMRAVVAAVRACPSITVLEGVEARRILTDDGAVSGVVAAAVSLHRDPATMTIATRHVVMASGGLGGLFLRSTNPAGCHGQGLAMAARAGATLADLEFVQFHPTALDTPGTPVALVSEAVRGEGARLVDETGRPFMGDVPGRDLAPRDVVARAIWAELADGHQTYLDARGLFPGGFASQFPTVAALCHASGIDPDREPIPVRPAAHYHMGGIAVDAAGRSTLDGLWACGEVARTGLHGANRLASNSLLEAVVCARSVAVSLNDMQGRRAAPVVDTARPDFGPARPDSGPARPDFGPARPDFGPARPDPGPVRPDPGPVRRVISDAVGVLRDRTGLLCGIEALLPLAVGTSAAADPALVGLMIALAALDREESRGAHFRTDRPQHAPGIATTRRWTLTEALSDARTRVARVDA